MNLITSATFGGIQTTFTAREMAATIAIFSLFFIISWGLAEHYKRKYYSLLRRREKAYLTKIKQEV